MIKLASGKINGQSLVTWMRQIHYGAFETALKMVSNKHEPLKKKYVRANDVPFMIKALRKIVMLRSRLRNKYNQNRVAENWNNFHR